jgi:rhodanese-related sulfurtransferase
LSPHLIIITGKEGVERRIDVVSMAIQMKGTVYHLAQAELCYAPQFGAAKDPVNMLGFIATNSLQQNTPLASWKVVPSFSDPTPTNDYILDVRTVREYDAQHIPQAVNIPLDSLRGRVDEVPRDRVVNVMCQGGQRAYYAVRILRQNGVDARFLSGGMNTYCLREGIAVVKP